MRATVSIAHLDEPDLGLLYSTILTNDIATGQDGGAPIFNLCIFAADRPIAAHWQRHHRADRAGVSVEPRP